MVNTEQHTRVSPEVGLNSAANIRKKDIQL